MFMIIIHNIKVLQSEIVAVSLNYTRKAEISVKYISSDATKRFIIYILFFLYANFNRT